MKTIFSLALLALVATFVAVSPVSAETVAEQEQELKTKVECKSSGSYGQEVCTAEATGSQKQRIAILGASTEKYHKMADTSLDTVSLIAVGGILTTGAGIAAKKFILK